MHTKMRVYELKPMGTYFKTAIALDFYHFILVSTMILYCIHYEYMIISFFLKSLVRAQAASTLEAI